jgi:hypothetical protein
MQPTLPRLRLLGACVLFATLLRIIQVLRKMRRSPLIQYVRTPLNVKLMHKLEAGVLGYQPVISGGLWQTVWANNVRRAAAKDVKLVEEVINCDDGGE